LPAIVHHSLGHCGQLNNAHSGHGFGKLPLQNCCVSFFYLMRFLSRSARRLSSIAFPAFILVVSQRFSVSFFLSSRALNALNAPPLPFPPQLTQCSFRCELLICRTHTQVTEKCAPGLGFFGSVSPHFPHSFIAAMGCAVPLRCAVPKPTTAVPPPPWRGRGGGGGGVTGPAAAPESPRPDAQLPHLAAAQGGDGWLDADERRQSERGRGGGGCGPV